ncbi:DMT family transporter [Alphaproteobacteria bacterium]|nr:DMT family transporter [Alphaproteobacteria bacterium]
MSSNIIGSLIWIIFIFLSLFTHMIIKSLSGDVDFIITLFSRFAYSLPILFILAYLARKSLLLQINNWKNIALRSFFGFVTMIMVFSSLQLIPIGLTTALAQSSAIYVTLLSPFVLGEKIGIIRWTAVITGLIGVFLMINPISIIYETSDLSSIGIYLAFGSAVTHAALALILRKIGKTEHPATTALIHNLVTSLVITFTIILFGTRFYGKTGDYGIEILITPNDILYTLISLGILGSFVQYLMAQSYKYAEATILVTLRYLAIPLATLFGYIIWNEIPSYNQITGGLLVIGSCLLITYREFKKK